MLIEELYKHGPLKPEEERGLTEETLNLDKDIDEKFKPKKTPMPERVGDTFVEDKNHHRTGWTFNSEFVNKRLGEIAEVKKILSMENVDKKIPVKISDLLDSIDMLRAIVYMHYPKYHGLPQWEPCVCYLESKEDILNIEDTSNDFVNFKTSTLWCAGREYVRDKFLCDYIGKNEKTKIICKFSKKGSGAPLREAPVDSETQKKMLQLYHKKQEEMKKLETNTEDDYLNSQWANPNNMKNSLYTKGDISWKFK